MGIAGGIAGSRQAGWGIWGLVRRERRGEESGGGSSRSSSRRGEEVVASWEKGGVVTASSSGAGLKGSTLLSWTAQPAVLVGPRVGVNRMGSVGL